MVGALSTTPSLHSSACPFPKPLRHPPAQFLVRGFQGLGRISTLCKVPRVVREPLGWHMASRHHTMMPPRCWAVLAASRWRGGGDQKCRVPCRERAVPPPKVAPAGYPMAAPRVPWQGKKVHLTWQIADCSCNHQEEPGSQHICLPSLVLALKPAFLQCTF